MSGRPSAGPCPCKMKSERAEHSNSFKLDSPKTYSWLVTVSREEGSILYEPKSKPLASLLVSTLVVLYITPL